MLLLDAASKLQLTASVAGSLDYTVSKVRNGTFLPVLTKGNITVITATDICAVPGGTDIDTVQNISICNVHASVTTDVTVNHVGGTTQRVFKVAALAPGETIIFGEDGKTLVMDANGREKVAGVAGEFIQRTVLSSGTSFTTSPTTSMIKIIVLGGGGGGAGCTSLASAAGAGGGGGSGAKAEKQFAVQPNTAYAYTIGAAGAGVSGAAGTNGGSSTFTGPGAVVVTSPGGTGGPLATAATTLTARAGGDGGTLATNGDLNKGGNPGAPGVVLIVATPILSSGNGGSTVYGDGGLGLVAVGNGNAATGFGAGGGGSATGASAVRTGGNGSGGVIVVEEYT